MFSMVIGIVKRTGSARAAEETGLTGVGDQQGAAHQQARPGRPPRPDPLHHPARTQRADDAAHPDRHPRIAEEMSRHGQVLGREEDVQRVQGTGPELPDHGEDQQRDQELAPPEEAQARNELRKHPRAPGLCRSVLLAAPSAGGAPSTATALEDESFWRGAFVGSGMRTERIARYDTR
nr:hypothetical protein [Streptomyces cavourensis]